MNAAKTILRIAVYTTLRIDFYSLRHKYFFVILYVNTLFCWLLLKLSAIYGIPRVFCRSGVTDVSYKSLAAISYPLRAIYVDCKNKNYFAINKIIG